MPYEKISHGFRLSPQATEQLEAAAEQTGANKTAIVEIGIALVATILEGGISLNITSDELRDVLRNGA